MVGDEPMMMREVLFRAMAMQFVAPLESDVDALTVIQWGCVIVGTNSHAHVIYVCESLTKYGAHAGFRSRTHGVSQRMFISVIIYLGVEISV